MPWIPLAIMAVSAIGGVVGSMEQGKAQKEQQQAQSRMENLKAARERTQQIRQARVQSANITQGAANSGAAKSSSAQTGASGVYGQAYGNEQYIGFEQQTGQAISKGKQDEINAEGVSSIFKGVGDIAGAVSANKGVIADAFSGKSGGASGQ